MIQFEIKPQIINFVTDELDFEGFGGDDAQIFIEQIMGLMIAHNCITVTPDADAAPRPEYVEGLVEALRPFAACAEVWEVDDAHRVLHYSRRNVPNQPDLKITVGDLQRAAAALASVEGGVK